MEDTDGVGKSKTEMGSGNRRKTRSPVFPEGSFGDRSPAFSLSRVNRCKLMRTARYQVIWPDCINIPLGLKINLRPNLYSIPFHPRVLFVLPSRT